MLMKSAIIDIGSNSVRLMLWADGKSLYKKVETTRLGEGIAQIPILREEAISRTIAAIAQYALEANQENARIFAFATAAVRVAENGAEFCNRVKHACGVEVEVISGEEEAKLAFLGALSEEDGGIIDIGGASTEISYRVGARTAFSISLPLGAVRLYDDCGEDENELLRKISHSLRSLEGARPMKTTYAVGGTASTLACIRCGLTVYNGAQLQGLSLSAEWVERAAKKLLSMTAQERRTVPGMDIRRVDIIGGGALLLAEIMKKLGLAEVKFSDRDNLEGYCVLRRIV